MEMSDVKRKARYGRRDWLVWRERDGRDRYEVMTKEAIKAALLAIGTKGRFTMVAGGSGQLHRVGWRQGILMRRNKSA
jgi:hypothetical protein